MTYATEFDIRINLHNDTHMYRIGKKIDAFYLSAHRVSYIHASGIEVGGNPTIESHISEHTHIALIFKERKHLAWVRKVIEEWSEGTNFYCVKRDQRKSLIGWLYYHKKMNTKVGSEELYVSHGLFPTSIETHTDSSLPAGMNKSRHKAYLIETGAMDTLDEIYPGWIYTTQGQNQLRHVNLRLMDKHCETLNVLDNYIIYGTTGTGKSSSVALLFPHAYLKQDNTRFWDGYDKTKVGHEVVVLDEVDRKVISSMSCSATSALKRWGDRTAFPVDAKYIGTFNIRPKKIIIMMNDHPRTLIPKADEISWKAVQRKYNIITIKDWLKLTGIRITTSGAEFYMVTPFNECYLNGKTFDTDSPSKKKAKLTKYSIFKDK